MRFVESGTGFLERSQTPWYPGPTLKDSLLNLLVFLLVFVGTALFTLATYALSLSLVPGGKGLVFANPYAAALIPGLLVGLVVALYRSLRRPGRFSVTWLLLAGAFLLLLTLPLPLIQQMPSVRASDDTPAVPGRFLPLADGSLLLPTGTSAVLVPSDSGPMQTVPRWEYDGINQRFLLSNGEAKALGSSGPERSYYSFTPALASLQLDMLAVYTTLKSSLDTDALLFWMQAWAITWLFLGIYLSFSLKTWPLVHIVLVLLLVRLALMVLVYAFWSVPLLVEIWLPGSEGAWLRHWAPVFVVDVAAATLFFLTWLSKPHRQAALP